MKTHGCRLVSHCCRLVALAGLATTASAQFADDCLNAPTVSLGTFTFDLTTATVPPEPLFVCGGEASVDQWVRFVSPGGPISISTIGLSTGNTVLSVHSVTFNDPEFDCGFALFQVAQCNDDAGGTQQSRIRFDTDANREYLVRIAGANATTPSGSVRIEPFAPVPGDVCSSAPVAVTGVNTFDPGDLVINGFASCNGFRDKYFRYTPAQTGALTVTAAPCSQPFQTPAVSVFAECGDDILACSKFGDLFAGTAVQAGVPIVIRIADDCSSGSTQFTIALNPNGIPANDTCEGAIAATLGDTAFDNTYATTESLASCATGGFPFQPGLDLFYTFTPAVSGTYDITTQDSTGISDTQLSVSNSCGDFPFVCNDDSRGFLSFIRTPLAGGQTYTIRVAGAGLPNGSSPIDRGSGVLTIRQSIAPSNDVCEGAQVVSAGVTAFDLYDATTGSQSPACILNGNGTYNDVWFSYTPTSNGPVEAAVAGDSIPVTIARFASCEDSASADVAGALFDGTSGQYVPRIVTQGQAGVPILYRVAYEYFELTGSESLPFRTGTGQLTITVPASTAPINDRCVDALPILNGTTFVDLTGSSKDCNPNGGNGQFDACSSATQNDIFYRYTAPASASVTLTIADGVDYPEFAGFFVSIYPACGAAPIVCSFPFGEAPLDSVIFNASAGQDYIIRVSSYLLGTPAVLTGSITLGSIVCDDIDFNNNDVFPEDADVIDFFNVLAGAECPACNDIDFNNNTVFPEDQDVIDFFNVLAGGECP